MKLSEVLGQKRAVPVLLFLSEKGTVKQSELLEVASSNLTIEHLGELLKEAGLITIKKELMGRKVYTYSLTPKGKLVAQKLKDATEITEGIIQLGKLPDKSFFSPLQRAIMYIGDEGKAILSKIRGETGCSSDDLRSLEDMGFITQKLENVRGSPENYVVLTPKGIRAERKLQEFAEEPRDIEEEELGQESKR